MKADESTEKLILCELRNGDLIVATGVNDCLSKGGKPVDQGNPGSRPATLVLYKLPSGNEVVGTYASFLADHGILHLAFDTRQKTPTGSNSSELFICRLPSGLGVIATYDECLQDGGTVEAKILDQTRPTNRRIG